MGRKRGGDCYVEGIDVDVLDLGGDDVAMVLRHQGEGLLPVLEPAVDGEPGDLRRLCELARSNALQHSTHCLCADPLGFARKWQTSRWTPPRLSSRYCMLVPQRTFPGTAGAASLLCARAWGCVADFACLLPQRRFPGAASAASLSCARGEVCVAISNRLRSLQRACLGHRQPHLGARGLLTRRVEANELDPEAMGRVSHHAPELAASDDANSFVTDIHPLMREGAQGVAESARRRRR